MTGTPAPRPVRERPCAGPRGAAQARVLERLLGTNRETAFGRDRGFGTIRSGRGLRSPGSLARLRRQCVPTSIASAAGEDGGAHRRAATVMFTTTSGTTNEPPEAHPGGVGWREEMVVADAAVDAAGAVKDHPACFDRTDLLPGEPRDRRPDTPGGVPLRRAHRCHLPANPVDREAAVTRSPTRPTILADPDARYFVMMRLALALSRCRSPARRTRPR